MKRLVYIALLSFLAPSAAFCQGIAFFTGDLKALFAQAASTNKPVFIDVYTTWCGPCKLLAKKVFPDSAVGAYMNPHFISYKIDAEKGEGIAFAAKNHVAAYPTALYFNPGGDLIYQTVGYAPVPAFIAEATLAFAEVNTTENLSFFRKNFGSGYRDLAFLQRYTHKLSTLHIVGLEARSVAAATYQALPEAGRISADNLVTLALANEDGDPDLYTATTKYWADMKDHTLPQDLETLAQAMLSANRAQLGAAAILSRQTFENRLQERTIFMASTLQSDSASIDRDQARTRLFAAQNLGHPQVLEPKFAQLVDKYWFSLTEQAMKEENATQKQRIQAQLDAEFAGRPIPTERQKSLDEGVAYLENSADYVAVELNTFAWAYYQLKLPAAELRKAIAWANKSVQLSPNNANTYDTKAHLLFATGQLKPALATQTTCIEVATKGKEPIAGYKKFLAEIQKAIDKDKIKAKKG